MSRIGKCCLWKDAGELLAVEKWGSVPLLTGGPGRVVWAWNSWDPGRRSEWKQCSEKLARMLWETWKPFWRGGMETHVDAGGGEEEEASNTQPSALKGWSAGELYSFMAASCVNWCVTETPWGLSCTVPLCSALSCKLWNVLHRGGAFETKNLCNCFSWKETPLGSSLPPWGIVWDLPSSVQAERAVVTHVTPKAKLHVAQIGAEQALECFRLHELWEPCQFYPRVIQPLVFFQTVKSALVSTTLCSQGLQWSIWVVWLHGIAVLVPCG